jgi:hypothetical protein
VDVARPVFRCPGEQQIDQFDDRGVARLVQQIARFFNFGQEAVRRFVAHLLEKLLGRTATEIVGQVDRGEDLILGCQHEGTIREADTAAEIVRRLEMGWIVEDDDEPLGGFERD